MHLQNQMKQTYLTGESLISSLVAACTERREAKLGLVAFVDPAMSHHDTVAKTASVPAACLERSSTELKQKGLLRRR